MAEKAIEHGFMVEQHEFPLRPFPLSGIRVETVQRLMKIRTEKFSLLTLHSLRSFMEIRPIECCTWPPYRRSGRQMRRTLEERVVALVDDWCREPLEDGSVAHAHHPPGLKIGNAS